MPYNIKQWRERLAERSDLSSYVVHLTRGFPNDNPPLTALDILMKILNDRKIIGSTTETGFIRGKDSAVCFQDIPLYSIHQNLYFEGRRLKEKASNIVRYAPVGLMFKKPYVFRHGGRPVIYDKWEDAKEYLPETEYWRLVNFDISCNDEIVDWTHEREWRMKGDFEFELKQTVVLVQNPAMQKVFIRLCRQDSTNSILDEVSGIVPLTATL